MQRTGGTSLSELLMEMSEHPAAEHEPFNWAKKRPRQFWPVTDAWLKTRDEAALRESLHGLLTQRYLIKHCYEILQMPFNDALMHVAAAHPYKHVLLSRRDEASRLISKFIAESQGTWFADYARKVFAEVASGRRALQPLPVDKVVEHFQHCRDATRTISDTLGSLGIDILPIYFEDLYTGGREERLHHLQILLDFLGFTRAEQDGHRALIQNKIFERGQNTSTIASYLPNLKQVLAALKAAGCGVGAESTTTPHATRAAGPAAAASPLSRLAQECAVEVAFHKAEGPFLEISGLPPERAVLAHAQFHDAARSFLSLKAGVAADGIAAHVGSGNDMRALFAAGSFNTVLWINALAQDPFFWRTLAEIRRVLAPGGTLVVVTPTFGRGGSQTGVNITGVKGNPVADVTPTQRIQSTVDYWRISPQTVRDVIFEGMEVGRLKVFMMPPRVLGVARSPGTAAPAAIEAAPAEAADVTGPHGALD